MSELEHSVFDLPRGSVLILNEEVVVPPHSDPDKSIPHPRIPCLLARLARRHGESERPYHVVVIGSRPAVELRRLVGSEAICVGYHGLEFLEGDQHVVSSAPAHSGRIAALDRFERDLRDRDGLRLRNLGARLTRWPLALAIDYQDADEPARCATAVHDIAPWAKACGMSWSPASCRMDILPADPLTVPRLGVLARWLGAPAALYLYPSRWGALPDNAPEELRTTLAPNGIHFGSLEVDLPVRGETNGTIEIRGASQTATAEHPLDGLLAVAELLAGLAGEREGVTKDVG